MNRGDLQRLSNARIREAKILFDAGEHSGAYYLAGYAVDCALKACFAKTVKRHDFPDRDGAGKVFTHKFRDLIKIAGLSADLDLAKMDAKFATSWELVCSWTEESRYATWTKADAEEILSAIVRRRDGVHPWIKQRW
jgi:HEPN domain-containing protein